MTHTHAMNGEIGCIPDNNSIYDTRQDAIESVFQLFPELTAATLADLKMFGVAYRQDHPDIIGASVIEVFECDDTDCFGIDECDYNQFDMMPI